MNNPNVLGSFLLTGLVVSITPAPLSAEEEITRCDVLASHPLDPDRITDGVSSSNVFREEAIAACRAAVTRDPENPRLNYQLGRVYFYDGQVEKALPHLEQAAGAGYRQAQFVLGYLLDSGLGGVEKNICQTEDLWARAARSGRLAALVSYPHHVMRGRFSNCTVQVGDAEMMAFLEQAKARKLDYYQTVLVNDLIEDLGARMADE